MSDSKQAGAENQKSGKAGGGMQIMLLAIVMVVTVLGAVGGAIFWLTRSGRLPVQAAGTATPSSSKAEATPTPTKMVVLEPLLVNLADPGGTGYLRVVVALRVLDPPSVKGDKPKEEKPPEKGKVIVNEGDIQIRDAALTVMGRETSEHLLSPDGKEALKSELKLALAAHVPDIHVQEILFTEFLVQR
jgi:flagellar FliL protein